MSRPIANKTNTDKRAAKRDSLDFRDWIYEPMLVPLEESVLPEKKYIQILNQGMEGACTGFGLAAVVNYLLSKRDGKRHRVSPRMLYEMAKRHDQWPGTSYDGSTARGAMKGWYKNGVCDEAVWPYDPKDPGEFTDEARKSALNQPLGAFYRVLPRRSDLHAALHEVPVIFATAATHKGWDRPVNGLIRFDPDWEEEGGHAFAIIGYTSEGFIIQNSWGAEWGGIGFTGGPDLRGCAIWQYPDFDRNVWDCWVARVARPLESLDALRFSSEKRVSVTRGTKPQKPAPARQAIAGHFIHLDDGQFDPHGDYFSTDVEVRKIVKQAVQNARIVVFYAHGGLNSVDDSARRAFKWRPVFERNGVYEIHFLWETGLGEELRDIILGKQNFVEGRAGLGISDWSDKWFERVTGPLGRGLWSEMQSDAQIAFRRVPSGDRDMAGGVVADTLAQALEALPAARRPKVHLIGHSAGSIFLGHFLRRWDGMRAGLGFDNLILFAPACTHGFFRAFLRPALLEGKVKKLSHFLLSKEAELSDNVGQVYRKSLLYLVSRSYQKKGEVVPVMGLKEMLPNLPSRGLGNRLEHFDTEKNPGMTGSTSHGGFDNDQATMNSMLRIILGRRPGKGKGFQTEELRGY